MRFVTVKEFYKLLLKMRDREKNTFIHGENFSLDIYLQNYGGHGTTWVLNFTRLLVKFNQTIL